MWSQEQRDADRLAAATTQASSVPARPPGSQHAIAMQPRMEPKPIIDAVRRAPPPLHPTADSHPRAAAAATRASVLNSSHPPSSSPPPPRRLASLSSPSDASFSSSRAALADTFERARALLASSRRAAAESKPSYLLPPIKPAQVQHLQFGATNTESEEHKQPPLELESPKRSSSPTNATAMRPPPNTPPSTPSTTRPSGHPPHPSLSVPFDDLFATDEPHLLCRFRAVDLQAFLRYAGLNVYYSKLVQCGFHTLASVRFVPRGVLEEMGMSSREIATWRDALERMEFRLDERRGEEKKYEPGRATTPAIEHVSRGGCALRSTAASPVASSSDVESSPTPETSASGARQPILASNSVAAAEEAKVDSSRTPAEMQPSSAPAAPRSPLPIPPSAFDPPPRTPPPRPPVPPSWQQPPAKPLYVMQNCQPRMKDSTADSNTAAQPLIASPHVPLASTSASTAKTQAHQAVSAAPTSRTGQTNLDALIAQQMQCLEISLARNQNPKLANAVTAGAPASAAFAPPTPRAAQPAPSSQLSSSSHGKFPAFGWTESWLQLRTQPTSASEDSLSSREPAQSVRPSTDEQKQPTTALSSSPAAAVVVAAAVTATAAAAPVPQPLVASLPKPHVPTHPRPRSEMETVSSARRRRLRGVSGAPPSTVASSSASRPASSAASSSSPPRPLTSNERRFRYDEQRRQERRQAQQASSKHSSQQQSHPPQQPHQPHQPHAHSADTSHSQAHALPATDRDLSPCPKRKAEKLEDMDAYAAVEEAIKKARAANETDQNK